MSLSPLLSQRRHLSSTALVSLYFKIFLWQLLISLSNPISYNYLADIFHSDVSCYLYHPVIPQCMDFTVTAAYISGQGVPVVITTITALPLRLIVKPCAPIKEADYKVTVSTNKPAVSLLDLFPGNY
jgi:hypothetical protein